MYNHSISKGNMHLIKTRLWVDGLVVVKMKWGGGGGKKQKKHKLPDVH